MLSLYLAVPPSADLAVLCTRAGELIAAVEAVTGQAAEPRAGERVRDKLATCARDWSGRTVAVFACAGSGLLEAWRLTAGILAMPPGGQCVIGLPACLSAVSAGAVPALVVPVDGLSRGHECGRAAR